MYTIMLELTVSVKILEQLPVIQVNPEQLTEFTQFVHVGEGGDIDITGNWISCHIKAQIFNNLCLIYKLNMSIIWKS